MSPLPAALAVLMTLAGVALLYAAWQGRLANRPPAVAAGWSLMGLAFLPWIAAGGMEFGLVLGSVVPGCAAWVFVALQVRRPARSANGRAGSVATLPMSGFTFPGLPDVTRHLWRFVLVVPLAGIAATLISIAFAGLLPWSDLNRWALIVLLMPALWGIFAAWLCSAGRWQVPAGTLLIGALLCAVFLL